jgi:hypothetical protein
MNSLHKKLRLKPGLRLLTFNAPSDFLTVLEPLPDQCSVSDNVREKADMVFWFVKTASEFDKQLPHVLKALNTSNVMWIAYPKGSSKMQTDLSRDHGWDSLRLRDDISFIAFISFNEIWSTFCIRLKTEADRKKEAKPIEREIFKFADSKTKTIIIPQDLEQSFGKNKNARAIFDGLAFSHRREYVDWIVSAKRAETRTKRIEGTIEKLLTGWKNPAGRP